MKLVVFPVAIVCDLVIRVVQSTFTVHLVFFPLAYVLTTFPVVESSVAVSQTVQLVPFVLALLISLGHKLQH